jgi:hypothetical protein
MVAKVEWSAALDARLRALRQAGLSWSLVAGELRLGRYTVIERGRRIGARGPRRAVAAAETEARDRTAWPPGHPVTWGVLTEGTVLAGQAYPYPVFL